VAFRYISFRSVFAADHAGATIKVNGASVSRLEQFFSPGTSIELSVDSAQTDESTRSKFEFLRWSNGGARTHTITTREIPDTIVAHLAAGHRLRITVEGATVAAVTSGVPGDMNVGVYLAEGTPVTLQASPQPGAVFAGWTGDTTAARDTLSLVMQHPFDLTANFVAVQNVVLGSAAYALLGLTALSPQEATYLDAVGNRNGVYDLGDFLAAADRSTLVATAR
jgi:hypothetical protein